MDSDHWLQIDTYPVVSKTIVMPLNLATRAVKLKMQMFIGVFQ